MERFSYLQVSRIFSLGFFAITVYRAKSDIYLDGSKGLKRHSGQGVGFANFAAHKFHHLNITPLLSVPVDELRECGRLCIDRYSCFSFNGAAFRDGEGKILCELLSSDKYNKSSSFAASNVYHHFSIKTQCSNDPCKNNATCVARYEDNAYWCTCAPGYIGRHCEIGPPPIRHWKLNGPDPDINLRGTARYGQQDGRTVLFLNGSRGTYAETPAFPLHSINLTIAVWIKLMVQSEHSPIYGDWSAPHSFRLFIHSGHLCFTIRDRSKKNLIDCHAENGVISVNQWIHVTTTWNRASRKTRLFINGEMKQECTATANGNLTVMNSSHAVYDIGLKRDDGKVAHAYFSDLIIFNREFQFSPAQVNEIKDKLFLNHPLHSFT